MRKNNFILIGCLVFLIGVTLFLMKGIPYGKHTEGFGAAFYPSLLLFLLAILVIILFIQTLRMPKDKNEDKKEKPENSFVFSNISFRIFCLFGLLFVLYAITLAKLGFIIGSCLFLIITMAYFKTRLRQAVVVSIVVVAVLYAMFKIVLRVPLPSGLLGVIGL